MIVFMYMMGMIPSLIVTQTASGKENLKPWSTVAIVLFWPISFFIVAVIFLYQLWKVRNGD